MRRVAPIAGLRALLLGAALALGLTACNDAPPPSALPPPGEVQAESTGHYCGMLLMDHDGPKGQIHLTSRDKPLWFSSVRDTFGFLLSREGGAPVAAVYVNDMARADWTQPQPDTWIEARGAVFVIGSDRFGGMGTAEVVPFGDHAAAAGFTRQYGGRVVGYDEVPSDYVFYGTEAPEPTR